MKRCWLLLLFCILLLSIQLVAKDGRTLYRAMEVQRVTKAPGVELTQTFMDYFQVSLKERLQKESVAAQVYEEGAAPAADANDTVVLEGKITAQTKHMMGVRGLNMEFNLYRKSDHRLITTIVSEGAYKGGFGGQPGKGAAEFIGKTTADYIRKHLKDAPSLASLPPAAPGAATAISAAAAPAPAPTAPKLGIQARVLTDDEAQKLKFADKTGVYVIRVERESVAELMQLQAGDVIVEVNGNKVAGPDQLKQMLGNGSNVVMKVWRNGAVQQLAMPQSL